MLAAGLWLRGPGESSSWVSKVPLGRAPSKPQFSALFRSLFARRATTLGSSGARLGWLRPGRALAALVLAAGLWLRGPGKSS